MSVVNKMSPLIDIISGHSLPSCVEGSYIKVTVHSNLNDSWRAWILLLSEEEIEVPKDKARPLSCDNVLV